MSVQYFFDRKKTEENLLFALEQAQAAHNKVKELNEILRVEKELTKNLLYKMVPSSIAERLEKGEKRVAGEFIIHLFA
jgi:hypothetical protein